MEDVRKAFKILWRDICWTFEEIVSKNLEMAFLVFTIIFAIAFTAAAVFVPAILIVNLNYTPLILLSYIVTLPIACFMWVFVEHFRDKI